MSKHLVIAAAGTGGHVMPGVAVAKKFFFPRGGPATRKLKTGWVIFFPLIQ